MMQLTLHCVRWHYTAYCFFYIGIDGGNEPWDAKYELHPKITKNMLATQGKFKMESTRRTILTGALAVVAGGTLPRRGLASADASKPYVYKQAFIPRQTLEIDPATTAMFVTDPQNDFMSESSPIWALVGPIVERNNLVERQKALKTIAAEKGIRVFYSPHMYTEQDFSNWKSLNGIDRIMFENRMFLKGTHGHEFHPELLPDENTIVMNPHKGLSNFRTGDALIQLRQYGIKTLIMYGMASNMCVESHARDAIEAGFDLIIVADATAAAGDQAYYAAHTNYEFLAHDVMSFDQVMAELEKITPA